MEQEITQTTIEEAKVKRDELEKELTSVVEYFMQHNPDLIIHEIKFGTFSFEHACGTFVEPRFRVTILI